MKKIGIFLGIDANAGGMFQYAESLLGALAKGAGVHWEVTVAYVSPSWEAILSKYPFVTKSLALGTQGLFISNVLMAARLPVNLVKKLSAMCNPIVRQLASEGCDAWIFPAQDALTFQVEGTTIGTVHDLMHRYEPDFPEVSNNYRWYIREYRFRSIANTATRVLVDSEVGCDHVVESYGTSRRKIAPLPYIPPSHILNAQVPDDFDEISDPASREDVERLFQHFESELEKAGFFHPPEKTPLMVNNLRAALVRARFTEQEARTFRGAIKALALGRGKARIVRED